MLAETFSRQQREALGEADQPTPLDTAMWHSEIPGEGKREQLERARQIAAYSMDPHRVAEEALDYRPDP